MTRLPKIILSLLVFVWFILGVWVVVSAPFQSGTDESIRYVAFAAAKNRWATEADFRRYGIEHFYYPPLYYLCFAPFYGDEPAFTEGFPTEGYPAPEYMQRGGTVMPSREFLDRVPTELNRLYRNARLFSFFMGLVVIASLALVLYLLLPPAGRWWLMLLGMSPCLLLPQFLYYQTLVNNDSLLNALAALAILASVGSLLALEHGKTAWHLRWAAGAAAAVGLGVLTKMSGFILLPLLPGLAVARALGPGAEPMPVRLRRAALLLLILLAVFLLAGGWWVFYKAGQGDWDSSGAHRLAHPWAFRSQTLPWTAAKVTGIVTVALRSYFGLFTGSMIGIPDWTFLAYLVLPALFALMGAAALIQGTVRGRASPRRPRTPPLRTWLIFLLGTVIVFNFILLAWNSRYSIASYGRLMFPSLVASHALFALLARRIMGGRKALLAAFTSVLVCYLAALFTWVFVNRMAGAVQGKDELLRPVAYNDVGLQIPLGPIWGYRVEESFALPPGRLKGFRVQISRSCVPQVGAVILGRLSLLSNGSVTVVELKPTPLGDNDAAQKWTQLDLERPIELGAETPVTLRLQATPPAFPAFIDLRCRYNTAENGEFPRVRRFLVNGTSVPYSLCLSAVYASLS